MSLPLPDTNYGSRAGTRLLSCIGMALSTCSCSDYHADLAHAQFGFCACGFPKAAHKRGPSDQRPRLLHDEDAGNGNKRLARRGSLLFASARDSRGVPVQARGTREDSGDRGAGGTSLGDTSLEVDDNKRLARRGSLLFASARGAGEAREARERRERRETRDAATMSSGTRAAGHGNDTGSRATADTTRLARRGSLLFASAHTPGEPRVDTGSDDGETEEDVCTYREDGAEEETAANPAAVLNVAPVSGESPTLAQVTCADGHEWFVERDGRVTAALSEHMRADGTFNVLGHWAEWADEQWDLFGEEDDGGRYCSATSKPFLFGGTGGTVGTHATYAEPAEYIEPTHVNKVHTSNDSSNGALGVPMSVVPGVPESAADGPCWTYTETSVPGYCYYCRWPKYRH